jgi:hypothetical protein
MGTTEMNGAWFALLVAAACSAPAAPPPRRPLPVAPVIGHHDEPAPPPPRTRPARVARYLPGRGFRSIGEGRSGAVTGDRRVMLDGDRATVVDADRIPDLGQPYPIPAALGSGTLFVGNRSVRYAPAFDAPLVTLAVAPDQGWPDLEVGVGHQRVLVRVGSQPPAIYELPSARPIAIDPPGAVALFGAPEGYSAALGSQGELFFSAAGGAPWRRVTTPPITGLSYDGVAIVVTTATAELRLDAQGGLSPRPRQTGMVVSNNVGAFDAALFRGPVPLEGPALLLDPLTRPLDADHALAIRDQDLLVIDSHTGATWRTLPGTFAGLHDCFVLRGGVPAFVTCHPSITELSLMRIDRPGDAPVLERVLHGAYAASFGDTAREQPLTLLGRCDGTPSDSVLCLRTPSGEWREVPLPTAPAGTDRVVAAASPGGYAVALGFDGSTLVVLVAGTDRVLPVDLPEFARDGLRFNQLTVDDTGTLRFLLSLSKSGRGSSGVLRVTTGGAKAKVAAQALPGRLYGAGHLGLLVLPDGTMQETLDGGDSFHDVEAPPGGVNSWGRCMETGCDLGAWYRVGWGE